MLDVIKSIINRKRSFLEAADLILEDMENDEIMDSLLDDKITDSEENSSDIDNDTSSSIEDSVVGDEEDFKAMDDEEKLGPIGADEVDDSMMIKDSDESSPDDEISDIFSISIDTRTNTVTDVLPVPPINAADAVVGDSDAKIDSGFGEESGDLNPMDGFLDESGVYYRGYEYSGHKYLFEGIDDGSSGDAPDMSAGDDVPDAPSPDGEDSSSSQDSNSGEESEVTTAVKQDLENKEKAEENSSEDSEDSSVGDDTDVPNPDNPSEDDSSVGDDTGSSSEGNAKIKDKIKILDDVTKKVSDLRSRLIDDIQ